ncbi:uncharacterized protein BDZ83DRAFT_99815 [Colletotrichum acutatum]|uniref:Uncharacterized protein n=1 Tax=Glomerella acutata TaxID=27357 RepID=A0AAD8XIK6_GLOAC|nr:uncharacterized protein BDZ83DRAFT_99815 [Colletotrichum acutatum]KAK1728742.1 hypothetical protein BDZ83DRAFT_99815 [Colletotrichum acutatum]
MHALLRAAAAHFRRTVLAANLGQMTGGNIHPNRNGGGEKQKMRRRVTMESLDHECERGKGKKKKGGGRCSARRPLTHILARAKEREVGGPLQQGSPADSTNCASCSSDAWTEYRSVPCLRLCRPRVERCIPKYRCFVS